MTPGLFLKALQPADLETFRTLLGGPDFGGCFCAVWTAFDETWLDRCRDPAQPNFELTRRDVLAGRQAGFLIYGDEDLIGWTGSGPKTDFPILKQRLGSRLSTFQADVWAIGCIALKADYRGRGLATAVVEAVVEQARTAGATIIEAYPTDPWDEPRSYRGALELYRRLGFQIVAREPDGSSDIALLQRVLSG
jgi:ribosomal protein S18 acetylase RimI-like enzyme